MAKQEQAKVIKQTETVASQAFLKKTALEQTTAVAMGGAPQLRRWERSQFLGQFPEQVLYAVRAQVLALKPMPPEIIAALADQRCYRIFLKAAEVQSAGPVLAAAGKRGIPLTIVHSPEYKNDTALVITTQETHDQENIFIEPKA